MKLTAENYSRGFLIDDELMAGVTEVLDRPGRYQAFVLRPLTGEYLGNREFDRLEDALDALNRIPRDWRYESSSGCAEGNCGKKGEPGSCAKGCKGCALGDSSC